MEVNCSYTERLPNENFEFPQLTTLCKSEDWPLVAPQGVECYWCSCTIKNRPLPVVVDYDDRRGVFTILPTMVCSWNCHFAVILNDVSCKQDYLLLLFRAIVSLFGDVIVSHGLMPSLPRFCLKRFYGTLTEEEYHSKTKFCTTKTLVLAGKLVPQTVCLQIPCQ